VIKVFTLTFFSILYTPKIIMLLEKSFLIMISGPGRSSQEQQEGIV
jgi:hypothetical protein